MASDTNVQKLDPLITLMQRCQEAQGAKAVSEARRQAWCHFADSIVARLALERWTTIPTDWVALAAITEHKRTLYGIFAHTQMERLAKYAYLEQPWAHVDSPGDQQWPADLPSLPVLGPSQATQHMEGYFSTELLLPTEQSSFQGFYDPPKTVNQPKETARRSIRVSDGQSLSAFLDTTLGAESSTVFRERIDAARESSSSDVAQLGKWRSLTNTQALPTPAPTRLSPNALPQLRFRRSSTTGVSSFAARLARCLDQSGTGSGRTEAEAHKSGDHTDAMEIAYAIQEQPEGPPKKKPKQEDKPPLKARSMAPHNPEAEVPAPSGIKCENCVLRHTACDKQYPCGQCTERGATCGQPVLRPQAGGIKIGCKRCREKGFACKGGMPCDQCEKEGEGEECNRQLKLVWA
ncbi:hypothetical protein MBLNU230_g6236t1 [Neophaeotheca triangularis]